MEENKKRSFFEAKWLRTVGVSAAALFLMVGSAAAVTTISANILTQGTLQADGDVTLGDGGAGDDITLSSGEGQILMTDIGAISVSANAGALTLTGNSVVTLESLTSGIDITSGEGDIDVTSSNTVNLNSGVGDVVLTSGTGLIELNSSSEVIISSASGDITLDPTGGEVAVLGPLFVSQHISRSVQDGIVAFATGGQAGATQITADAAFVTTVATAADSVKLPPASSGLQVWVSNLAAANSMNLFPFTGDVINETAANTAKAVAAKATVLCTANDSISWECVTMAR